jgi:putative sigma-54 modulation protein
MQVLVTFRHVAPSGALREYAEEKVQRIEKYVRRVNEAHVILSVEKQRHTAEVTLNWARHTLTATEETGDLYAAIDLAMDKIERQVKKLTAKRKDRKHARPTKELSVSEPSPAPARRAGSRGRITRTERVPVKPMSVEEALMQMKLMKNEFLLFRNAANDALSVLYRRKNGDYGLIEPEVP